MNIPVRRAVRKVLYLVLLVALFQLVTVVPVRATGEPALGVDVTIPTGPFQLGDEFVIDIDVSNTATNSLSAVQLQLPYDNNLLYVGGQNLPTTGVTQALLDLGDLASEATTEITVTARIRGIPRTTDPIPLPFQALAVESTSEIEEAELNISRPSPEQDSISGSGEFLETANGRVDLDFPAGWYTNTMTATLDFELLELHQLTPDEVGTVLAFEVEAVDSISEAEIESFNAPITMTLAISDLVDLSMVPFEELTVRTREDDTEPWTTVPFTMTQSAVQFEAEHFSEFWLGQGDPEPWKLTYTPPGSSPYTGAATYSYPFPLPPGRGGLTPSLGLYYNSRGVDGMEFPVMSRGAGAGWSIPQMEITNGNALEWFDPDPNGPFEVCDNFRTGRLGLLLNGVTYHLAKDGSGRHGQYRANGDPSLYIEYIGDDTIDNITGEYWIVRTPDGTTYRFGYTEDAEQVVAPLKYCLGEGTNDGQPKNKNKFAAASWKLDSITDKYGRQIRYDYKTQCGKHFNSVECRLFMTEDETLFRTEGDVALETIEYNFDVNGDNPETIVRFEYGGRNNGPRENETFPTFGYYRPSYLIIEHDSNVIAAYNFAYDEEVEGQHFLGSGLFTQFWAITRITPFGNDYNAITHTGTPLPAQEFFYEQEAKGCGDSGPGPNPPPDVCVKLLTGVENGYGAYTKITYHPMNNNGDPAEDGRWLHVTQIDTWDGVDHIYDSNLGNDPAITTIYDHSNYEPCFERSGADCEITLNNGAEDSEALVGFKGVEITTEDSSDTVLSHQEQKFDTSEYWLSGKITSTVVFDPVSGNKLSEQIQEWTYRDPPQRFTELVSQTNLTYHPAPVDPEDPESYGTLQEYFYNIPHQNQNDPQAAQQWGRPTKVTTKRIMNGEPESTPYITNKTRYLSKIDHPNGKWLVVPYQQSLHEGDNSAPTQVQLFLYDGQDDPDDNQNLTLGQLDWTLTLVVPENAPTGQDWNAIATHYEYFTSGLENGLIHQTTQYNTYASVPVEGNYTWGEVEDLPVSGDWRSLVEMGYTDDALNIDWQEIRGYEVTDEQRTEFAYDADFYWLPATITDTNGIEKNFEYDGFGRLISVKHPDPIAPQNDIEEVTYDYEEAITISGGINVPPFIEPPFEIKTITYPNESGQNVVSNEYYNGLGQLLQQRTFDLYPSDGVTANYDHVWLDYEYDALGRLICQTVQLPGGTLSYVNHDCIGNPANSTATEYDGLGRVIKTTSPSGATTYQQYPVSEDFLWQSTYDANKHAKRELYDALGRLVEVREIKGNCAGYDLPSFYDSLECLQGETAWSDYATTVYEYDIEGNLLKVEQEVQDGQTTAEISTIIVYDELGRKETMDDPDMGSWQYEYDINGNLISQVDLVDLSSGAVAEARLCLYYDSLDRLIRKVSNPTPNSVCPELGDAPTSGLDHLATYVYDTAPGAGIGKLAKVSWGPNPDENYDEFTYDNYGRLIEQERLIDDTYYVLKTNEFDNLDRPTEIIYPNNDEVRIEYDRMGENVLQFDPGTGLQSLVSDVTYNSRNRLTKLVWGASKHTILSYTGGGTDFRLNLIQHGNPTDLLPDYHYTYDAVGNIATAEMHYSTITTDEIQTFTYDHLDRLIGAETNGAGPSGIQYDYTYGYDILGNIITKTDHIGAQPVTLEYTYDYDARPHAVTNVDDGSTTSEFTYDGNGNMWVREDDSGDYIQEFDVENRLIKVTETTTGDQTHFYYDADGQRIKTVEPDGSITHTPFPNYEVKVVPDSWTAETVTDPGFEGSSWTLVPSSLSGTTMSVTAPYAGAAHGGSKVLAISNLASAQATSSAVEIGGGSGFGPNPQYRVDGSIKGFIEPETSGGEAEIWIRFEDVTETTFDEYLVWSIGELAAASWEPISTTDQIAVNVPGWADQFKVIVRTDKVNGWIAFDNLTVAKKVSGVWSTTAWDEGGFEESGEWTTTTASDFPASSVWFGESGPVAAEGENSRYSLVMSNHGYSQSTSPIFTMENATLSGHWAYAWLRGDFGSAISGGGAYLVAHYYEGEDEADWLGQETLGKLDTLHDKSTWQTIQGQMAQISGTTHLQLQLVNAFTTGFVEFDDISAAYEGGTQSDPYDVPDSGFETGGYWSEWDNSTGTAVRDGNSSPHGGSYVLSLGNDHRADGYAQQSQSITITAGETYRFQTWAKKGLAGGTAFHRLAFYKSGGVLINRITLAEAARPLPPEAASILSGWQKLSGVVVAPDEAVSVRLEVVGSYIDGYVYFDDVTLEELVPGTTTKRSVYNLAGRPIAVYNETFDSDGDPTGQTLHYILADHLGSHSAFAKANGTPADIDGDDDFDAQDIIRYEPFGDFRGNARPDDITDRSFTGHQDNMDIGLVYMRARYYLPGVGRFVSADTIVPDKENPQAFNRYSYTANNPVKFVDPSGHCWGFASGLRNTFYSTTCENIDQALRIINHEDASAGEKALAVAYVGLEATAHATVVVGTGVAAVGCLTGAGTVICTGAGTATSAACSDGVCMNEAHMTVEGVSQVVNTLSADGDPSNEIRGAAAYLNRIQASGGFTAEQVRGWFQESNVTIRVQPQQLMGSVRGAYGAIGDGAAGYLRILPDAGRITWLHEFTHFLQDKAGGFQGFNMASTAQIELQAWSWMYNNAQMLGLSEAELAEVMSQMTYYSGQIVP